MEGQISIVVADGSMQEVIMNLLAKAGLPVTINKKRTKEGSVDVPWIKRIAFQKAREIPHYLFWHHHFDLAIVGEDWIADSGKKFSVLLKLPIARNSNKPVKVVLAVSEDSEINRPEDLPPCSEVATEYVHLTRRFFQLLKRDDINVVPSFGNTEHKIRFGSDAIVDITESGDSLRENNLKVIKEIMESSTVIVANPATLADDSKRRYIDCFVRLIQGSYQASQYVFVIANVPKAVLAEASQIMGGLKGPTRSPLTTKGWYALQSVVRREDEHAVIFKLLQIGVTDIIVNRDIPLIMT